MPFNLELDITGTGGLARALALGGASLANGAVDQAQLHVVTLPSFWSDR